MLTEYQSDLISKIISRGSFLITILIYFNLGYDPVNLPKQFFLILVAGIVIGLLGYNYKSLIDTQNAKFFFLISLFSISLVIVFLMSKSPFELKFYGNYGRNTGLITYLCLSSIAFGLTFLKKKSEYNRIIRFFFLAVSLNIIYGIFVSVTKKDPFPWKNPYGNFLGTLGNPDFASAFLGIGFSLLFSYLIFEFKKLKIRILASITLFLMLVLIQYTHALQGVLVAIIGVAISLFYLVLSKRNLRITISYCVTLAIASLATILGMLQIGPLSNFVYKTSVSIRGEYWRAGLNMFNESPIWGLGLDAYGDYYRKLRDASALILPGKDTITDAAHNVFIDILAGGGLLLFIPYILIQIFILRRVTTYSKSMKKPDVVFISLTVGWITYLAQSFVSINQIGLAIWGWVFMGCLIGYTSPRILEYDQKIIKSGKSTKNSKDNILAAGNFLTVVASTLVALFVAIPPILAEYNWRSNVKKGTVAEIIKATERFPTNNMRFAQTAQLLFRSNLQADGMNILRSAVEFDPNYWDHWYLIYSFTPNELERSQALQQMKRLDPRNNY